MTPDLQIALDTVDLPGALGPLQKAAPHVDIIECGTILVLCEGYHAVRAIRALFPDKRILADVRIAEAGSKICDVAAEFDGEVQVELADEWYDADRARAWREAGVRHVIVKRSRDREAAGDLSWKDEDMDRVDELAAMGLTVTITGGVSAEDLPAFAGRSVGIVIAGRAIVGADDPAAAAARLRETLHEVWS